MTLTPNLTLDLSNKALLRCINLLRLSRRPESGGMRVIILVTNKLPAWAYGDERYSDLKTRASSTTGRASGLTDVYHQHGVEYDIDNPTAMRLMGAALTAAAQTLGCHPSLDSWVLANEPNFHYLITT